MFADIADEICRLGSENLTWVFRDTLESTQGIGLEIVSSKTGDSEAEGQPVATVGLPWRKPVIQIADSLQDNERTEAIAHEIGHLLLVYRFGLGLVGRRMPHPWDMEEVCYYLLGMGQHWDYLLGQVINTAHHLILIGYLREKYGIVSHLHLRLLQYHFEKMVRENYEDRESLYAQGLITFEYRKLIGEVDWVIPLNPQGQMIRQSYLAAQRHFDHYHFQTIPSPSSYRNDILSFLEDLGYAKEGFIFFQPRARKRGQNASADGRLSGATSV